MAENVFRMHGFRGNNNYYYLTPVVDCRGNPVQESYRNIARNCNEWAEPPHSAVSVNGGITAKAQAHDGISVFMDCVPRHERISSRNIGPAHDWREKFADDNHGCCFHIWERNSKRNGGGLVKVIIDAEAGLECMQGGDLAKVERVPLSALPDVVKQESMKMIKADSK